MESKLIYNDSNKKAKAMEFAITANEANDSYQCVFCLRTGRSLCSLTSFIC